MPALGEKRASHDTVGARGRGAALETHEDKVFRPAELFKNVLKTAEGLLQHGDIRIESKLASRAATPEATVTSSDSLL